MFLRGRNHYFARNTKRTVESIEMNANRNSCQLTEPKGSFLAIAVGASIAVALLGLLDYLFVDLIPSFGTLEWMRDLLGVLSGNEVATDVAWVYVVVVSTSFVVGMVAVKWYKAVASAIAVPIALGVAYSLIGMSFGYGLYFSQMFISPILFSLPYIVPSLVASLVLGSLLSKKNPIWREKLVSDIK